MSRRIMLKTLTHSQAPTLVGALPYCTPTVSSSCYTKSYDFYPSKKQTTHTLTINHSSFSYYPELINQL